MVPRGGPVLTLAAVLLLAGCAGSLPGVDSETPTPIEPHLVGTTSSGGQCVESPMVGMHVESHPDDGGRTVTVAANVTVPDANYVVADIALRRVDDRTVRLDVTTTEATRKPPRDCPAGAVAQYEATLRLPAEGCELQVYHDGTQVSAVGSGSGA